MAIYNDAFVERFLKPWNAHDVEAAMAFMSEDCLWEIPRGAEAYGARFEGREAVRAAIAAAFRTMPDIACELVRSSFGPDLVVLELLVTATLANGRTARFQACDVMAMCDGKVAAKRSYRKIVE